MIDITRAEVLGKDEVVWIVKIDGKELRDNIDAHALANTLDQMRVRGVYKG